MKAIGGGLNPVRLKTDFQRGIVFVLLATLIFGGLLLADRPHWARPWFIASLFTFAVWRLSCPQANQRSR